MQCETAEFLVGAEFEKAIDDIVKLIEEWPEISGRAFGGRPARVGVTLPECPIAFPPSSSSTTLVRQSDA
jgi:hypothetical protein